MDIAGVLTLLETAHEAATAVDIERVTLTKATPEQRLQLVYLPGAAHPVPVRVPGDHPSAGVPPGGSLSLGWAGPAPPGATRVGVDERLRLHLEILWLQPDCCGPGPSGYAPVEN